MPNKNRVPLYLKCVAALPWNMLEIRFHVVLQQMLGLLKSASCVLENYMFHVIWLNRY